MSGAVRIRRRKREGGGREDRLGTAGPKREKLKPHDLMQVEE